MKIELDVEYISDLQSLLNFADCSRILKSFDLIQDSENWRRESRSDRSGRCIGRMAATGESLVEQYETRRPVRRGTRGDWTIAEAWEGVAGIRNKSSPFWRLSNFWGDQDW